MIRELEYEHDPTYGWKELVTYDLHSVAMDLFVFFVVGRLWADGRCGVDSLGFLIPSAFGAWFFSAMAEWKWAQHNVRWGCPRTTTECDPYLTLLSSRSQHVADHVCLA
jgi:hypothetical protein